MLLAGAPEAAFAGPPYLSDDPQPTDAGHWEIYTFATAAGGPDGLDGEAGLDLNYGPATDLQVTAVLPLAFANPEGFGVRRLRGGLGDAELAAKYRFLHQSNGSWTPDVALFPRLFVPTGGRAFGTGHASLFLPLWAEKDFGPWSVFGGGGWQLNPGSGQRDFWQGGVAISRAIGKRGSLGAEVYAQTRDTTDGGAYQAVDIAATYQLVKHWSLLASAGPAWNDGRSRGYVFYAALKADY